MTIHHLYDDEEETFTETFETKQAPPPKPGKFAGSRFFSSCVSRLSFVLLMVVNIGWFALTLTLLIFSLIGTLLTGGRLSFFYRLRKKSQLNLRRSLACALGLLIGCISPSFGIMVACTYFLMYDKKGIDEVIPGPIRAQFKELFNS